MNRGQPAGFPGPLRLSLRRVAAAGAGAGLLIAAGLVWFATPPAAEHQLAPTDAIVVLTGGSERLHSGVALMREGKGHALLISGVGRGVGLDELLRIAGGAPAWLTCCVAIDYEAENTEDNAEETARWMRSGGYRSLRLVTAWYHMPRSRLEFARAMPGIEIVPHPVFPPGVKERYWWAWRGTAALLVVEYVKYLAVLFRPLIEPSQPSRDEPVEAAVQP
ncbi:MAG TPA: YdcF family protein [Stellaceae bacterium]|nr:YdcF family protein [Stellaceae bacterium]